MSYISSRAVKDGMRHTVYVTENGRRKSIGTFSDMDRAQAALDEAHRAQASNPLAKTYRAFVEQDWLDTTEVGPSTRLTYTSMLRTYVLPTLGSTPVGKITESMVKALFRTLQDAGMSPWVLYQTKCAVSSTFRLLTDEGLVVVNPTRGLRIKQPERSQRRVLEPSEAKSIMSHLTETQALFVRLMLDSGVRFGEATELRVGDVNWQTGAVIVARAVADVGVRAHPTRSSRFLVKKPKSGRERRTSISQPTLERLIRHKAEHGLGMDDLLFPSAIVLARPRTRLVYEHIDLSGASAGVFGEFEHEGRTFRHGTLTGYAVGRCRCDWCKAACRQNSRERAAKRRARRKALLEQPELVDRRSKVVVKPHLERRAPIYMESDVHLARDAWARVWHAAIKKAGLDWTPRTHDLRHANATWALKSGLDLQTVQARHGHADINTTMMYLHSMRGDDEKASAAIDALLT